MGSFSVSINTSALELVNGEYRVRVSSDANNGISYSGNKLIATKGRDGGSGASGNFPGNAIDGTVGVGLSIVQFNSSVSRRVRNAGSSNEGVYMPDVITGILSS